MSVRTTETCCDALKLVTNNVRDSDRLGLMYKNLFNIKTGEYTKTVLVLNFRNDNGKVKFILINRCPFCGKGIDNE